MIFIIIIMQKSFNDFKQYLTSALSYIMPIYKYNKLIPKAQFKYLLNFPIPQLNNFTGMNLQTHKNSGVYGLNAKLVLIMVPILNRLTYYFLLLCHHIYNGVKYKRITKQDLVEFRWRDVYRRIESWYHQLKLSIFSRRQVQKILNKNSQLFEICKTAYRIITYVSGEAFQQDILPQQFQPISQDQYAQLSQLLFDDSFKTNVNNAKFEPTQVSQLTKEMINLRVRAFVLTLNFPIQTQQGKKQTRILQFFCIQNPSRGFEAYYFIFKGFLSSLMLMQRFNQVCYFGFQKIQFDDIQLKITYFKTLHLNLLLNIDKSLINDKLLQNLDFTVKTIRQDNLSKQRQISNQIQAIRNNLAVNYIDKTSYKAISQSNIQKQKYISNELKEIKNNLSANYIDKTQFLNSQTKRTEDVNRIFAENQAKNRRMIGDINAIVTEIKQSQSSLQQKFKQKFIIINQQVAISSRQKQQLLNKIKSNEDTLLGYSKRIRQMQIQLSFQDSKIATASSFSTTLQQLIYSIQSNSNDLFKQVSVSINRKYSQIYAKIRQNQERIKQEMSNSFTDLNRKTFQNLKNITQNNQQIQILKKDVRQFKVRLVGLMTNEINILLKKIQHSASQLRLQMVRIIVNQNKLLDKTQIQLDKVVEQINTFHKDYSEKVNDIYSKIRLNQQNQKQRFNNFVSTFQDQRKNVYETLRQRQSKINLKFNNLSSAFSDEKTRIYDTIRQKQKIIDNKYSNISQEIDSMNIRQTQSKFIRKSQNQRIENLIQRSWKKTKYNEQIMQDAARIYTYNTNPQYMYQVFQNQDMNKKYQQSRQNIDNYKSRFL